MRMKQDTIDGSSAHDDINKEHKSHPVSIQGFLIVKVIFKNAHKNYFKPN